VDGEAVAAIGPGLLVLAGVARGDTPDDARHLACKVAGLRIFDDEQGKLNRAVGEAGGALLVVSQFTLYADCARGHRPGFADAALPDEAVLLLDRFVQELRSLGREVRTGRFGARMLVELQNDGPVTLILESRGRRGA